MTKRGHPVLISFRLHPLRAPLPAASFPTGVTEHSLKKNTNIFLFRHLWRFIRSCKSNTERPWYPPSASLNTASYVTDKRHQNQTPTWLQGSEPQVSQGSKPRTRASKVSLSQVWRRRQDTLSQAPIPVIPTTMAILTVSPATAFLSITVTLTPGNELTFCLF